MVFHGSERCVASICHGNHPSCLGLILPIYFGPKPFIFPCRFRGPKVGGSFLSWEVLKNWDYPLVNDHIAIAGIPPCLRGYTSTQSGAPIFQPAMLDYRSVYIYIYVYVYIFFLFTTEAEKIDTHSFKRTSSFPLKGNVWKSCPKPSFSVSISRK